MHRRGFFGLLATIVTAIIGGKACAKTQSSKLLPPCDVCGKPSTHRHARMREVEPTYCPNGIPLVGHEKPCWLSNWKVFSLHNECDKHYRKRPELMVDWTKRPDTEYGRYLIDAIASD